MSSEVVIRLGAAEDIARLRPLWEALYVDQQQKGMVLTVPPGAFDAWAAALTPVVNRFGCVALAESSEGLHGFVAGRSRPIPPYFGGGMAGFVSDVFVEVAYRGRGIARGMIDCAAAFFASGVTAGVRTPQTWPQALHRQ